MNEAPSTLVRRLRLCVVRGSSGPWPELLADIDALTQAAFCGAAPYQVGLFAEFRAWLPGWLIAGQRLASAHGWLEERIHAEECPSADEQDRALRGYLTRVFQSGVGDFFRERAGRSKMARSLRHTPADAVDGQPAKPDRLSADDFERLATVRQSLAGLPLPLRVPFRLRFYEACGPLPPDELAWVAEQSGHSLEQVERLIADELARHPGADCPLGAEFVGELLRIPAAADGRFTAVNQRVCRARQQLRDRLAPEDRT